MAIYVLGGINAASSSTLLHSTALVPDSSPNCVSQGQAVYKVKQGSLSGIRLAQPGNVICSRVLGLGYCSGNGRLRQGGKLVSFGLKQAQPKKETLYRVSEIVYYRWQGCFKQWSRGDDGIPVFYADGQDVDNEQQAAADEEVDAEEETRMHLSPSTDSKVKKIFIFGFGYTSCALASYLKKNNWKVSGTCRSDDGRAALEQCGYSVYMFNSDNDGEALRDDGLLELQQASHWLTSVPPVADMDKDPVLATHSRDLKHAVENRSVRWIGYFSSTGVYGDWHGNWVDEESEPQPVEQRAVARLAAERDWLEFGLDYGVPVHVFRLGGIYGPGRSALDTILRKGALSDRQQNRGRRSFTSRIHVADICQTVLASIQSPCPGRIYNVVDDNPAPRKEVLAYALDLINKQDNFDNHLTESVALDRTNLSGRIAEKRVSNKRLKEELKVQLLYPTYRSGLKAIYEAVQEAKTA